MNNALCACLALYDWKDAFDIHFFHDLSLRFFSDNGVLPEIGGLNTTDSSPTLKYKSIASRLKSDPKGEWTGISLYHMSPDYHQFVFGWRVVTCLMDDDKQAFLCCHCDLAQIRMDYFDSLLDEVSSHVELRYGIGYYRTFDLGPAFFAPGMVVGYGYSSEDLKARERIAAWFRERIGQNRHLHGYLRDVYPLNVLSAPHLGMPVNGIPLANWIRASADRGTLRPLAGGAWLWRIDEQHVPAITAELEKAGLLIATLGATR